MDRSDRSLAFDRGTPFDETDAPASTDSSRLLAVAPGGRPLEAAELRALVPLVRAAERVRGLRVLRPIPVAVETADEIARSLERDLDEEQLVKLVATYRALGLLPRELDVRQLLVSVLREQVVGYYDPKRGRLVVRDDAASALAGRRNARGGGGDDSMGDAEGRMVLVHEIVHALQDQHHGLQAMIDRLRDNDAQNAFKAVVEGDATLAMVRYVGASAGVDPLALPGAAERIRDNVRSSGVGGSPQLARAPRIVREVLVSQYGDGLVFTLAVERARGRAAVDALFATPPASSEQVLHPERFLAGDAPVAVTLPDVPAPRGTSVVHEDTIGELELRIWLTIANDDAVSTRAAEGWGGDRVRIWASPDGATDAFLWVTTWDTDRDAAEMDTAARAVASTLRAEVSRRGREVVISRGVTLAP